MQNGPYEIDKNNKLNFENLETSEEVVELSVQEKAAKIAGAYSLEVAELNRKTNLENKETDKATSLETARTSKTTALETTQINRSTSLEVALSNANAQREAANIRAKSAIEAARIGARARYTHAGVTAISAIGILAGVFYNYRKDQDAKEEAKLKDMEARRKLERDEYELAKEKWESQEWKALRRQLMNKVQELSELTEDRTIVEKESIALNCSSPSVYTLFHNDNLEKRQQHLEECMKLNEKISQLRQEEASLENTITKFEKILKIGQMR